MELFLATGNVVKVNVPNLRVFRSLMRLFYIRMTQCQRDIVVNFLKRHKGNINWKQLYVDSSFLRKNKVQNILTLEEFRVLMKDLENALTYSEPTPVFGVRKGTTVADETYHGAAID